MNNYIYEMDVTRLRISYLLPENLFCVEIRTILINNEPYDSSNMEMEYSAIIRSPYTYNKYGEVEIAETFKRFTASSFQDLIEDARIWVISEKLNKQSIVDKSPDDGTDSVIAQ